MIRSLPYFLALLAGGNRSESVSKRSFCDASIVTETTACAIDRAITRVLARMYEITSARAFGCAVISVLRAADFESRKHSVFFLLTIA